MYNCFSNWIAFSISWSISDSLSDSELMLTSITNYHISKIELILKISVWIEYLWGKRKSYTKLTLSLNSAGLEPSFFKFSLWKKLFEHFWYFLYSQNILFEHFYWIFHIIFQNYSFILFLNIKFHLKLFKYD